LRIDIPTALASDVRNTNKAIRREQISPPPEDVADGYTAWSFAAETELLGTSQVNLVWEAKIEELGIGASQDITIPRLIPMNVDLATGQIVVGKSESIDVQPTTGWDGLIPIDPHNDLRRAAKIESPAMAFTFVDQWQLEIRATRYELEDSQLTSIDRAVVRIVVLEQGELSIQALYRMRSARQRLAIRLPADAEFDAQPLRIDGKPVSAERESNTTISAPLLDQDLNDTFVLELRYSTKGTPAQLDLPWLPDEPAIQKVFISAHLPEKQVLLASSGSWSNEQVGIGLAMLEPRARQQTDDLIGWVTEGNAAAANSARTFPIGKSQQFVYSTLRPEDAPDGSLSLKTTGRRFFNGAVLLVIASLGLPLFRRGVRPQLILLLLLSAGLLLIGVFVPELARTLLTSIFPAAVALVILVWLIGHVSRLRWSAQAAATTAAPAAEGPATSGGVPPEAGDDAPATAEAESPFLDLPASDADEDQSQEKGGQGDA
jgi:hypothetical protein